ncbi:hypothetical protein ScalyP_jg9330 [Parmales sp. scaly parma]|nr:hypothetical protein ScalyP_jg9330 [Parmales sp. scaly parma]
MFTFALMLCMSSTVAFRAPSPSISFLTRQPSPSSTSHLYPTSFTSSSYPHPTLHPTHLPTSPTTTSLNGMFGLGAPEIAIVLVAAGVLLGPQKLGEMTKELGKVAGELKDVPKEFQEGLKEGEAQTKAMKAETMKPPLVQDAEKVEEKEKEKVEE